MNINKNIEVLYSRFQEWLLEDYLISGIYVPWTFLHFLTIVLNYPYNESVDIYTHYKLKKHYETKNR